MRINNAATQDRGTIKLSDYVRKKGVALLSISKNTGISYDKLCRSLSSKVRALRTDEFLAICGFLELDPMKFYESPDVDVRKGE